MENNTILSVTRQLRAMPSELYEVGLFDPQAQEGAEMLPRTWDAETLLRSVGWLRHKNAEGRNIYIRPKGEHSYSLVDDLTRDAVTEMKKQGFQPALVVETSPANFQAWLQHDRKLPADLSTTAARGLAERFEGDPGSADWRHFGRLAGFTNRKAKHQQEDGLFPFVRLIEAAGQTYPQAAAFLSSVEQDMAQQRAQQQEATRQNVSTGMPIAGRVQTIDDFRAKPRYSGDHNRIDLAYATYALANGVPEAVVREAITSRDLTKKGGEARQADYVNRTVEKAYRAVSRAPGIGR